MTPEAGIVVIGDEVLAGQVTDVNSTYLIGELHGLGMPVGRVVIVPDQIDVIATEIAGFSGLFEVVLTTGGVGPTHDDLTYAGVARAFGVELERSAELEAAIRAFYGDATTAAHLAMARVPAGTELVWSGGLPFPVTRMKNVWVMPGEPTVMRMKFAAIREHFRRAPYAIHRVFTRLDEGVVAPLLARLQEEHPEVRIGSYPQYSDADYRVQVTVEAKDAAAVERVFAAVVAAIGPDAIVRTS